MFLVDLRRYRNVLCIAKSVFHIASADESTGKGYPFSSNVTCAELLRAAQGTALRDMDGICKRLESELRSDIAETAREINARTLEY